jgi:hypothetical protein
MERTCQQIIRTQGCQSYLRSELLHNAHLQRQTTFLDVGQRGNIPLERISSHGFLPSTPEAELPKSEKGDESDS